jgi:hypothetical protein
MSDITADLLATPRLLVARNDGSCKPTYFEIILKEVAPSGLYIRYQTVGASNSVWTEIDTYKLIEVLWENQLQ